MEPESIYKGHYAKGCDLIQKYMRLHDEISLTTDAMSAEIQSGIKHLRMALKLFPQQWTCWWIIGKGYQRLDENAYMAFSRARNINLRHPEILNELALECLETGRFEEAMTHHRLTFELSPSPGYRCNIAICWLLLGNLESAEQEAQESVREDPQDELNQITLSCVQAVRSGRCPQPTSVEEMWKIPEVLGLAYKVLR